MEGEMPNENARTTGYAPVNDLNAYFEIHGEGEPLVLLHGAYMNLDGMAPLLRPLAEHRQVIALELQGHGRTADADRPITYEGTADDTAGVMTHLGIERADVVGYSMGAGVGLQLAIRHPERCASSSGPRPPTRITGCPPRRSSCSRRSRPRCSRAVRWRPSISGSRHTRTTSRPSSGSSRRSTRRTSTSPTA